MDEPEWKQKHKNTKSQKTPLHTQETLNRLIAQLQRGKVLEQYRYFDDYCTAFNCTNGFCAPVSLGDFHQAALRLT